MSEDFAGGDVAELRRQLEERTSTIQTMKVKTKDFIAKMQAEHSTVLQSKDKAIEEITARNAVLQARIEVLTDNIDKLEKEKGSLEDELEVAAAQLTASKNAQSLAEVALKGSEEECVRIKAALTASQQDDISSQLGDAEKKILLLETELQNKDSVMKDLVNAQSNLLKECKLKSDSLAELELELSTNRKTVEETEEVGAQLEAEVSQLKQDVSDREQRIAVLEAQISNVPMQSLSSSNDAEIRIADLQEQLSTYHAEVTKIGLVVENLQKVLAEKEESIAALQSQLAASTAREHDVSLLMEQQILETNRTKEALSVSEKLCSKLQDEQRFALENTSQSIESVIDASNKLETQVSQLQAELVVKQNECAALQNQFVDFESQIETLTASIQKKDTTIAANRDEIELLSQQVQSFEYEVRNATGRGEAELIIVKADLQGKTESLVLVQKEMSELTAKLHLSESQRVSLESQRSDLLRAKEELALTLASHQGNSSASIKKTEVAEAELRAQLEQSTKALRLKVQEHNNELDQLQSDLARKSAEYEMVYTELVALRESSMIQQSRLESSESENLRINTALQSEIAQNSERKKKVRAYVDNLTSEKVAAEEKVATLTASLVETNDKKLHLEQQIKLLESRLNTMREQAVLDQERLMKERQSLEATITSSLQHKDSEIGSLRRMLEEKTTMTMVEIEATRKQMDEVSKEAETHKSKRLAARNEMIGLVEALEKAQGEADEMHSFFTSTLVPIASDQVSGLERALMSLEAAVGMLSSKKMVRFHSKTTEFLQRRLEAKRNRQSCISSRSGGSDDSSRGSGENDSSGSREELVASDIRQSSVGARSGAAGTGRHVLGSGKPAQIAGLGESMELAHNLFSELQRMRTGLILLAQTLDRLHEAVRLDTKCCGGVYELIVANLQQGNSSIPKRGGYNKVDTGFGSDEDDLDVERSGLNPIGAERTATRNPLGGDRRERSRNPPSFEEQQGNFL